VNPDGSLDTNVILNGPTDNIALTDPYGNLIYPATSASVNAVNQTLLAIMNTTGIYGVQNPVTVNQGTSPWVITGSVTINNPGSGGGGGGGIVTQGTVPWIVSGSVGVIGPVTISNTTFAVTQSTSPWVTTGSVTINNTAFGAIQNGNWSMRLQDGVGTAITSTGGALDVNLKTPLGQAAMSASVPVVLASNQTALPVTMAPSAASTALSTFVTGSVPNTAMIVKTSSGRIHYLHVYNPNVTFGFLQFYDLASGSVHVGSTTPTMTFAVPPMSVLDTSFENPVPAANAITLASTSTFAGGAALVTPLALSLMYI
jgi:hypothetical protein